MINLSKKLTYAILLAIVVATLVVVGAYKIHSGDNLQDLSEVDNTLNVVIIIGVLFGIVKFASKISLGCSFAKLTTIEVVAISVVYFCIPMILALFIDIIGNALGSVMGSITEMNAIIGGSQAIISIILLAFGIYTVKMWTKSKKDISKKLLSLWCFPVLEPFLQCLLHPHFSSLQVSIVFLWGCLSVEFFLHSYGLVDL